ncbi:MAG: ComEC/Rec2 family competence protein, partial [Blastocatellia bacterium]
QPFVYLTALFVFGILLESLVRTRMPLIAAVAAVLSVGTAAVLVLFKRSKPATIAILIAFACCGFLDSSAERGQVSPDRLKRFYESGTIKPDDPVELTGVLAVPPEPLPDGRMIDVEAESLGIDGQTRPASGLARLTIGLEDRRKSLEYSALKLDYGSRVRILLRLDRAKTFNNPGSPDFNDFLERRGYDLKGTIKSPLLIETIGRGRRNPVLGALYHARLAIMSAIDSRFDDTVGGTLKAMLAGNRYFVDKRTVTLLREGATFHTLVIAGLHVGIIAWLLLGSRSGPRRRPAARVVFALTVLWGYAVMVGMAPPVQRTTVMITVAIAGPLLFRQAISLNTLSLAAFAMLAFQPSLIGDAGFQLSFAAVGAVIALAVPLEERLDAIGSWRPTARTPHPPVCSKPTRAISEWLFWDERRFAAEQSKANVIYRLDKSGTARLLNRWWLQPLLRYTVLLVMTSAAIQLGTLPLMIYYFNRVAPVGLLLNIVAGFFTAVIMIGAMVTLALGPLSGWLASLVAHVVTFAHFLLVNSVVPFLSIPGSTFRAPQYDGPWTVLYAVYFIPLILLSVLVHRWRPVDEILEVDRSRAGKDAREQSARDQARNQLEPADGRPGNSAAYLRLKRPAIAVTACLVLLVMSVVAVVRPVPPKSDGKLTIDFLDVGQGDSALITFPHGTTMLVDAGGEIHINRRPQRPRTRKFGEMPSESQTSNDQLVEPQPAEAQNAGDVESGDEGQFEDDTGFDIGEAVVARFLWSRGLRRIDYLLATHAHEDHIGGMEDVLRDFKVGELLVGHEPQSSADFRHLEQWARMDRTPMESLSAGRHLEFDGVTVDVLWPPAPQPDEEVKSGNNESVVIRLVYGSVSFLMTGDIETPAEQELVAQGVDLHADVLKVAHHGSKTSSTEDFVSAVKPKYAIISVGRRSRFGHPNQEVLDRYRAHGIDLLWTGREGTITAMTDGVHLTVKAYLRPNAEP